MKIVFDGRTISGNKSGAGVYSDSLLKGLSDVDAHNTYKVFVFKKPFDVPANFKFVNTKISHEDHPMGELWEYIFLPYFFTKEGIDVFHSPTFHMPIFTPGIKKVITIHDLILLKFPQTYPRNFVRYAALMLRIGIKAADAIIVPSESTKKDIIEIFKVKADKIYIIPYGVRHGLNIINDNHHLADIKNKYNLPDNFILFISTIEPRKNLEGLIRAYSNIRKTGISHKLVVCGGKGWLNEYERITKIAGELGVTEHISFIGYLPDEDISAIYNLAALFVYPSFYEGFGFPPLEAMACGCPVITSNTSSLGEVVGDAAITVDPHNLEELTRAMYLVLTSAELKSKMKKQGLKRVKMFSWERSARETINVYEKVCEK